MEANDVLKEFNQRVRSPLFGSFIIIWLFWNWKIPVAIFLLNKQEIINAGFDNIISYLQYLASGWGNYVFPLVLAFLYSVFNPFLSKVFKWVNFKASVLYNKWELGAAMNKGHYVPTEWYMRLNERYNGKVNEVNETIKTLDAEQKEIATYKEQIEILSGEMKKLNDAISDENKGRNIFFLNGSWKITAGQKESHLIMIINGGRVHTFDRTEKTETYLGKIELFHYKRQPSNEIGFAILQSSNHSTPVAYLGIYVCKYDEYDSIINGYLYTQSKVPSEIQLKKLE